MLEPAAPGAPRPIWGQRASVKMQGVLEDRTVVEKDRELLFTIGEGDVSQVKTRRPKAEPRRLLKFFVREKNTRRTICPLLGNGLAAFPLTYMRMDALPH